MQREKAKKAFFFLLRSSKLYLDERPRFLLWTISTKSKSKPSTLRLGNF